MLSAKLNGLLTPDGIPPADSLTEGTTSNTSPQPTVEQYLWVTDANRPEIRYLPPNTCRSLRAGHIARDLSGLGCADPNTVRLVLLAQSEALLVFQKSSSSALNTLPIEVITGALRGPEGFSTKLEQQTCSMMLLTAPSHLQQPLQFVQYASQEKIRRYRSPTIRSPLVRALACSFNAGSIRGLTNTGCHFTTTSV